MLNCVGRHRASRAIQHRSHLFALPAQTKMKGSIAYMANTLIEPPPRMGASSTREVVLRTRNLSKHYGSRLAVNSLNMEVRRGDIFGFLGPNGAGKTTTIRMALGLITPSAGSVEILGIPVYEHKDQVLPRVGALIETPALHLYLSGRDNLRAVAAILGQAGEDRIERVLTLVGLQTRQHDLACTYSLGMKQRLGVAIALLDDPEVLILDEPANGLDPAGIVEMRDLMRTLAAQGKTIFISSHVLTEVQQICTRIAIINLGQLITESTVAELTRSHGSFIVTIDQAQLALQAITRQAWGTGARLDADGQIVSPSPDGRGRGLIQFLVAAGYIPDRVSDQQESLEDVFLRLT